MNSPVGICIKQNKVYVTQYCSHCLNVYSTEGKYLNSVGVNGKKELEFDGPVGLDISTDKDRIYIDEYNNGRVQCLNLHHTFVSIIDDVDRAKDVKLTSNEIVVLSRRNLCVSLYTYSHQLIREIIPGGDYSPVFRPAFLILDKSSNILITDYGRHCVSIFSLGGELIHRFGKEGEKIRNLIIPSGITFDIERRIIIVSENPEHCIQVY